MITTPDGKTLMDSYGHQSRLLLKVEIVSIILLSEVVGNDREETRR